MGSGDRLTPTFIIEPFFVLIKLKLTKFGNKLRKRHKKAAAGSPAAAA
jgi:hypothetical protein